MTMIGQDSRVVGIQALESTLVIKGVPLLSVTKPH